MQQENDNSTGWILLDGPLNLKPPPLVVILIVALPVPVIITDIVIIITEFITLVLIVITFSIIRTGVHASVIQEQAVPV